MTNGHDGQRDGRTVVVRAFWILLLLPHLGFAAPGDRLGQISLPSPCANGPFGLAFDGSTIYYTVSLDPVRGAVHMTDAATGVYKGSLVANRGGVPINVDMAGLAFDRNRGWLWSGSVEMYALSVPGGEVQRQFRFADTRVAQLVAYDPVLDKLWEGDSATSSVLCWRPDGFPCGGLGGTRDDRGLSHDGVDLWRYLADSLPAPAPPDPGYILPTKAETRVDDLVRTIGIPGINYRDIAYDCVTFPVPVVWVTDWWNGCLLTAYEVETRAPECIQASAPRLLRGQVDSIDPVTVRTKLPLVTANADFIYRPWQPLDHVDDRDLVLANDTLAFVAYRLLGDADALQGNVLKLVKDRPSSGIRATY